MNGVAKSRTQLNDWTELNECKTPINWTNIKTNLSVDVRATLKMFMIYEHLLWLIMVKHENNYMECFWYLIDKIKVLKSSYRII